MPDYDDVSANRFGALGEKAIARIATEYGLNIPEVKHD
jgi:hypothetical protein